MCMTVHDFFCVCAIVHACVSILWLGYDVCL